MSDTTLTPADLIHGGLYHKRGYAPDFIGRLYFEMYGMGIQSCNGNEHFSFVMQNWEGIPITPEILRDWFGFCKFAQVIRGSGGIARVSWRKDGINIYTELDTPKIALIDGSEFPCEFVHDLQRLHFAKYGTQLDGGPNE